MTSNSLGNGPRQRVTLATLAEDLGVSLATISNAYNRPGHVSPALRDEIFARAKALGYSGPHAGARSLRVGKANAVGLVFTEELSYAFSDPAIGTFLEGLSVSLSRAELGLLIIPTGRVPNGTSIVNNALVDAFVLYSAPFTDPAVDAAVRRGLPLLCVDDPKVPGVPLVGINDRAAARAAAEHLIALGHRKISIVISDPTPERTVKVTDYDSIRGLPFGVTAARLQGYMDACKANKVPLPSIAQARFNTVDAGREVARVMLAEGPQITGVLATSDLLAIGVHEHLTTSGVRIPNDVSIIGFDDLPQLREYGMSLTTIHQPLRQKGLEAGHLLIDLIDERHPKKLKHLLAWNLKERASTSKARPS